MTGLLREYFRPNRRNDIAILAGTATVAIAFAGAGYLNHEQSKPLITSCASARIVDSDDTSLSAVVEVRRPSLNQASKSQLAASAMDFINAGGCAQEGDEIYDEIVTSSPTNADCIEAPRMTDLPQDSTLYLCRAAITTASTTILVAPNDGHPAPAPS